MIQCKTVDLVYDEFPKSRKEHRIPADTILYCTNQDIFNQQAGLAFKERSAYNTHHGYEISPS